LEHYRAWLLSGGISELVTDTYHVLMAGHVLGLALKPCGELDPDIDLQRAHRYLAAKRLSQSWTTNCCRSLNLFRRYLLLQRHQEEQPKPPAYNVRAHTRELPAWLIKGLRAHQKQMQRNWRLARLEESIRSFWSKHLVIWRFLCKQCGIQHLRDIRPRYIREYVDARLAAGCSPQTVNGELSLFRTFLLFLQEGGSSVPPRLLHVQNLHTPDPLPRYLTNAEVRLLLDEFESSVQRAQHASHRRLALLHRASFHLLWQCGLRLGELAELRLADVDLGERRLNIRDSKNRKDRTVYVADAAAQALREYLAVRGGGLTDHIFLYRHAAVKQDLIRARLKELGTRIGVHVYPHRLRHTCATQLLNAGCPVTTIQRVLGHKRLSTTMIYARAYDRTVAEDYFAAMQTIERNLEITTG
jgi:site-specific recombinase XerD